MALRSEQMETLRQLGLGDYAARAYLALLDLGETEARDVSRLSGVPLAKMYQTLDALQAKGLCDVFPGSPKRYAPVSIGRYVAQVAGEHRRAAEAVESRKEDLESRFPMSGEARASDRGRVLAVNGRKGALDHEARLLAQAKTRVLVLATPGRLTHMAGSMADWEAAHGRGVELCLLIPDGPGWARERAAFARIADVRVRGHGEGPRSAGVLFMVFDETDALVVDRIPDDRHAFRGHDVGIHLTQEGLVSALHDTLWALWERSPRRALARMPAP